MFAKISMLNIAQQGFDQTEIVAEEKERTKLLLPCC
jgi:hypothetical protein